MAMRANIIVSAWALSFISTQICFAADQRAEIFQDVWLGWGQRAEEELEALPENGHQAFRKALIACSLYADYYDTIKYKAECRTASKYFSYEFGDSSSSLSILFESAAAATDAYRTQKELDYSHGRYPTDINNGGIYMDVLKKAYQDIRKAE
jgi:hypothetical protein